MNSSAQRIDELLEKVGIGDQEAEAELQRLLRQDLTQVAERLLRKGGVGPDLGPEALVDETYLRLADRPASLWRSRTHFLSVAAQIMRTMLVDRAREALSAEHGRAAAQRVGLDGGDLLEAATDPDSVTLHRALDQLRNHDERVARVVELRVFGGFAIQEIAEALGVSERTVKRNWAVGRALLNEDLSQPVLAPNLAPLAPLSVRSQSQSRSQRLGAAAKDQTELTPPAGYEYQTCLLQPEGLQRLRAAGSEDLLHLVELSDLLGSRRATEEALTKGSIVGNRFKIRSLVGVGDLGEFYEAEDLELAQRVALHIVDYSTNESRVASENAKVRFRKEVFVSRAVTHPNICRVYDIGYHRRGDREFPFLSMEFLEGDRLDQRLHSDGRLSSATALEFGKQIAAGLDALHDANLIHLDLKPENVTLVSSKKRERAVVTDFRLSELISDSEVASTALPTDTVMGTWAYMAPEQIAGEALGSSTDVFAFGELLFEMLSGALPFSPGLQGYIEKRHGRISVLDQISLEPNWTKAIRRCLDPDPAKRFQRAGDVIEAIESGLDEMGGASQAACRSSLLLDPEEALVRAYLLGNLTDREQADFEKTYLFEVGSFDVLMAAEDDLVEDYVAGDLSEQEAAVFEKRAQSARVAEKIAFAKALREQIDPAGDR